MCRFQFLPKVFMLFYYFCNGEILSHRFRKSQYEIMYFFFRGFLRRLPGSYAIFLAALFKIEMGEKMLQGFKKKTQTGLSFRTVPEEKKRNQNSFG